MQVLFSRGGERWSEAAVPEFRNEGDGKEEKAGNLFAK